MARGCWPSRLPPTVPHEFPITDTPRYREIADKFGMIAHEQGICGCHVHVAVPSREAAIRVSNRLRPWLPLLLALTANSAVYRNADTGYASWRSVLWARWPSAGPPPHFDSADEYDAMVAMLQRRGRDARRRHGLLGRPPVGQLPDDRGARRRRARHGGRDGAAGHADQGRVMTALEDERRGEGVPPLAPQALRAAYWKSARDGLDGQAIDLVESHASRPARELLAGLVDHVRPALEALGDYDMARAELARIAEEGNGAMRQRRAWRRRGEVADVLAEAATATLSDV